MSLKTRFQCLTLLSLSFLSVAPAWAHHACSHSIVSVNTWSTGGYHAERARLQDVAVIGVMTQTPPAWARSTYLRGRRAMVPGEVVVDGPDFANVAVAQAQLQHLHGSVGLIVAGSESPGVKFTQQLSRALGLSSVRDPFALEAMTHKIELAKYMRLRGLSYIPFSEVNSEQEVTALAPSLRYPCIIKPDDAAGSTGVSLVSNAHDLLEAYRASLAASQDGTAGKTGALIQPFLYDPYKPYEYAINTFNEKVTGVWEYRKRLLPTHGGMLVPLYDVQVLLPPTDPRVKILIPHVRRFRNQFEGYVGPLHVEVYLLPNGEPVVGDAGFRFAGGLMPEGELFATGNSHVEMPALWVRDRAAYRALPDEYTLQRPLAGVMGAHLSEGGIFTRSRLPELERKLREVGGHVVEADLHYAEHAPIRRTVDAKTMLGMINITATDAVALEVAITVTKNWLDTEQYRKD